MKNTKNPIKRKRRNAESGGYCASSNNKTISYSVFFTSSSSASHRRLVAIAVSLSLLSSGLIVASAAALLYYFRHRKLHLSPAGDDKESRSDSLRLYPPNTATSDGGDGGRGKARGGTPNTSSEFLYLGTLVSSRGGGGRGVDPETKPNSSISSIGVSASPYRKLGSPELKPLPPLSKTNSYFKQHTFRNPIVGGRVDKDDDDGGGDGDGEEEFFSPRGSTESPSRNGSSSRRVLQSFEAENLGNSSFNSRTPSYPCSKSASPATSVSNTLSPSSHLSPSRSFKSRSPDFVVKFPPPSRPPPLPLSSSSSSSKQ